MQTLFLPQTPARLAQHPWGGGRVAQADPPRGDGAVESMRPVP